MVGGLYQQGDIRRDKGFSIFYIGINLGSFLATTIIGFVVAAYGWHAGFGLAGIAMVFGLIIYIYGQKYLTNVGNLVKKEELESDVSIGSLFAKLPSKPVPLAVVSLLLLGSAYGWYASGWAYGLLFIFISLIVGMMMMIYSDLNNQVEKDRYMVLLLSFVMVIIFWGAFEQAGGLMNLYTETKTNRVIFGFELPTELFQSLNAGFIILFATTVANYWASRQLKNKEASSLFKMATGIIIMGVGFVYMVFAAMEYENNGASSMIWLVLAYLFHTIGELCISPVALSFITKLAPIKYASLMMGVYFAATGLGNKLAGVIGESATEYGEYSIFLGITGFTVVIGLIFIFLLKPLKRLVHGIEEEERKLAS